MLQLSLLWAHESEKLPYASGPGRIDGPPTGAWLVVAGGCRVRQRGREIHARAGEWVFPEPGPRDQFFDSGTRILSVGFLARWPHGADLIHNPECRVLRHPDCGLLGEKARALVRAIERVLGGPCDWEKSRHWRDDLALDAHLEVDALFHLWLACFVRIAEAGGASIERMSARDPRVEAAVRALEGAGTEDGVDWAALQGLTGLSRRRLEELFRRETGMSVSAFARKLRVQAVCRDVLDFRRQIKEVAAAAGFGHIPSFSRWFRRETGMSPTEYRASKGATDAGVWP